MQEKDVPSFSSLKHLGSSCREVFRLRKTAVLDADEFEGKAAKAVKQAAAKFGISRFKERFFVEDDSHEIQDEVFGLAPGSSWWS